MNETSTDAPSIFAPLWKRKWMILAVAILVAAGTYLYEKSKPSVYQASTRLYLGGAGEQQAATGVSQGKTTLSGRALTDQVELINSAEILLPVRKRLREEGKDVEAKATIKAVGSGASDFITIETEASSPRAAKLFADAVAVAYVRRERALYTKNVENAITNARGQLRRVEASAIPTKGKAPSNSSAIQSAQLATKINQLETQLASFAGVQQVALAKAAPLPVSPQPKRDAIFALLLGLILGCVAAYVLARFDHKIRSLAAIERLLGAEVLAALPEVRNPSRRPDGTRAPARPLVEPLRRLQTALQLGLMPGGHPGQTAHTLLFMSPDPGDGRSTLVANLGRVLAEAGERVAIVEADYRRPSQARILDIEPAANGLTEVISGRVELGAAMQQVRESGVPVPGSEQVPEPEDDSGGTLSVLLCGAPAPNPPALTASEAMAQLLTRLSGEYDRVLIDAPSPLAVSDAVPLMHRVDGIVLLARVGHTRDLSAERLGHLLANTATAPVIGVVGNCVPNKDIERFGYSAAPAAPQRSRKLIGR